MTQAHEEPVTRRCPRCGGLMRKPPGSTLFWHADNNHPRCDITNLADIPETALPVDIEQEDDSSSKKRNRKK
ncbi:MAG TPA: hypothetical protein VKV20_11045 [Ktedonobacteraceae bacterium]|jgi:ssDNA-binding Zn-finger/Zn-ribbon topoisomerase 1|nr:hypothetical protein [Ktedonobacteraceae bacterium]